MALPISGGCEARALIAASASALRPPLRRGATTAAAKDDNESMPFPATTVLATCQTTQGAPRLPGSFSFSLYIST